MALGLDFASDNLRPLYSHIILALGCTATSCDRWWLVSLIFNVHLLGWDFRDGDLKWLALLILQRLHRQLWALNAVFILGLLGVPADILDHYGALMVTD